MTTLSKNVLILASILGAPSFLFAQSASFELLNLGKGAVSASYGNAVSAEIGGIEGALNNPATLASVESEWTISGAFNPYSSMTMANVIAAKKLGAFTLALSGLGLFYDGITGYVAYNGDAGLKMTAGDIILGVSGSVSLGGLLKLPFLLDLGFTMRYAHEMLDATYLSALLSDIGFVVGLRNILGEDLLSLGVYGNNLGLPLSTATPIKLPAAFSAGFTYRLRPKKFFLAFKVLADASYDSSESLKVNLGAGFEFFRILSIRGGYRFGAETQGLSAGAGVQFPIGNTTLSLDYAVVPKGEIGVQQSFQLGAEYRLGKDKNQSQSRK